MTIFKKTVFPTKIFIIASLSALILLPVLLIIFKLSLSDNPPVEQPKTYNNFQKINTDDPFITKIPGIKDMIKKPLTDRDDPDLGNKNAPVTIVEYSDYQCKFCQNQEAILRQVVNEYKDNVRLIWKDYPADDDYSPSWLPGMAARCALEQNKFWEYHDMLFQNSANTTMAKLLNIANSLKLDKNKFSACLDGIDARTQIKNNIIEANALDITGVPFIYVNEQEIMGEVSYEELKEMVENEIKKN